MTSNWKIIIPAETTNYVVNPSFEINVTDGWSHSGDGTSSASQGSTYSKWGIYSCELSAGSSSSRLIQDTGDGISLAVGETVYATAWLYGVAADLVTATIVIRDTTNATDQATSATITADGTWQLASIGWTNDTAGVAVVVIAIDNTLDDNSTSVWVDGCQLVKSADLLTYCDGTLEDSKWLGAPHFSKSFRSSFGSSGGKLLDFADDLNFHPTISPGSGMPPYTNLSSPLALNPGELVDAQSIQGRTIILSGSIIGASNSDFHAKKQRLIKALDADVVKVNKNPQPRVLRYTGAAVDKEISVVYDGGLEEGLPMGATQIDYQLRLLANDPMFYEVGQSGAVLAAQDTLTAEYIYGRIDGIWDGLGPPSSGGDIKDMVVWHNKLIVAGSFTNWDGIAAADYIAAYDLDNGTWEALGTYPGITIYRVKIGPDDALYVGADAFYKWDGSSWTEPGSPAASSGSVYDFDWASDGKLYIVGGFLNWDAIASADYIVTYNGVNFSAIGTGANAPVISVVALGDAVYFGGNMTAIDGTTVTRLGKYNISDGTITQIDDGFNNSVQTMTAADSGRIYVGGDFTDTNYPYLAYIENDIIYGFGSPSARVDRLHINDSGIFIYRR